MVMKQGLYAQVVKLCRKDFKFIVANKNKNEAKFKFQGQSARSQRWFDIEFDWIKVNFSTRDSDFYENVFGAMTIQKIQIQLKYFKFQYEIQNVCKSLSFTMMPQCSSIVRSC